MSNAWDVLSYQDHEMGLLFSRDRDEDKKEEN